MTTPTQAATQLYNQLKPEADRVRSSYILDRTPAELQSIMQGMVGGDAGVSNGAAVMVVSSAGIPLPGTPGVAEVANGVLTDIKLTV